MREMKDSGIEWIGKIPEDWKIVRLRFLGETKSGLGNKKPSDFGHGYPFVTYKNVYNNLELNTNMIDLVDSTTEEREKFNVKRGDAFFTGSSETIDELGFSSVCTTDIKDATFNGFTIRFRPNNFENYYPEFMKYTFRSNVTRGYLEQNDNSITRANLSQKILKSMNVVIPSLEEQELIADYLDEKVEEIDNIISNTQKTIEEYKKYKQSVITEAVTKGLNPNVEMKDSGIEWIGEIPKHWQIKSLRYLGSLQNGISKAGEFFGHGYPFLTYSDVYKNLTIPKTLGGKIDSSLDERDRYSVLEGDIFFTRTSETIEEIGFISTCLETVENATFAGFLIRLRLFDNSLYKNYSKYYFSSNMHRKFFVKQMNLVTRASLSQELLKKLPVLIPPMEEQINISTILDKKCLEIDNLISKKQELIIQLEIFKKSLIYECVTGKKDILVYAY